MLLEGDLLGKTFDTNFSDPKEIEQLEQDAESYLEKETKAMLWKLQKEYKVDILGIGRKVKAFHPQMWRKLDWKTDFPKADIKVTYDVKLRRTGMEME
ncbi:Ger(x)C family spore germination C-terminal domain-containing protein [Paenibacillus sp. PvP091]|uniref:Ger(x)C family spore germination C-terminal domain-containing protein n=1 Tax=Paenibacillus sp. PvP091 TaxID=2806590 RepID=UPI0032AF6190